MTEKMNLTDCEPEEICRTAAPEPAPGELTYAVANLQGIGRRERQEDSFAFGQAMEQSEIKEKGLLFVVADGMGGMNGGWLAGDTAVKSLLSDYEKIDLKADIPSQLALAVSAAGDRVYGKLRGEGGSTVVAAVIYDEKLYFASVGDSFAYLLRNRQLVRLNLSHNLLNEAYAYTIMCGSLDPEPARSTPQKEALTQFLGMGQQDEIDCNIKPIRLRPGDVIMLCSDGVAGVLDEQCLTDCLSYGIPADMCSALEENIRDVNNRYQDNYTALIVQCRKNFEGEEK